SVCGLPWALSVTVKVAVLVPDAVGVKLTVILQAPPAARLEPQLLVWVKSPPPGPAIAMLVMLSAALVAFDSVTVCTALVALTSWSANVNTLGESLTAAD